MKRALVIKVNQLGDTIVDLPMIEALVLKQGAENVYIITTPIAAQLFTDLLAKENLLVISRESFNSAWKSPIRFYSIWKWAKKIKVSSIIVPSDQGYVARLLARCLKAKNISEMSNPSVRFSSIGRLKVCPRVDYTMQENNWELLRAHAERLGWNEIAKKPPRPSITFKLKKRSEEPRGSILIHSGSSRDATRWGNVKYIDLATRLAEAGYRVSWIDEGDAQPAHEDIKILERRPLLEFAELASSHILFIGNNSGPMHLCDVLGIPLLILCGPVAREWDPYWSVNKVLVRDETLDCQPCETCDARMVKCGNKAELFACMTRPSVDMIFNQAIKILG